MTWRNIDSLLTPWSRFLLEKLTGSQLVKKCPSFYGTRKFLTAFTSARHLSLSWATFTFTYVAGYIQTSNPIRCIVRSTYISIGTRWCSWLRHCFNKPEDRGFDSRWHHRNFSSTFYVRNQHGPEVSLARNWNEYQEYFLGWKRWSVRRANSFTTFMCWLSWNLRVSTFWNRLGLSRPIQG